ncbi:hypothetical protein HYY75_08225, partial [bacterium]|nr:hypothetical protein [bacterium]
TLIFSEAFAFETSLHFVYERPIKIVSSKGPEAENAKKDGYSIRVSKSNPEFSWIYKKTEVKDENHLLQLLGAKKGFTFFLSEGQKALLAAFKYAQTESVKSRLKYGETSQALKNSNPPGAIEVSLADLSGFSSKNTKKKFGIDLKKDFWPWSSGTKIMIGSPFYNSPFSASGAKSTMVHELAHSLDNSVRESDSYGKDGIHSSNEKTAPKAAWVEGWAEFNSMLDFKSEVFNINLSTTIIKIEDSKTAGKYKRTFAPLSSLTGREMTEVEGINALILYRLSKDIPNGREKVFASFVATNNSDRDLSHFLRHFVASNPEYAKTVAQILDKQTYGKLKKEDFSHFLGNDRVVDDYLKGGRKSIWGKIRETGKKIKNFFSGLFDSIKGIFSSKKAVISETTGTSNQINSSPKNSQLIPVKIFSPSSNPFGE